MALQPDAHAEIDRADNAPFLLRIYWRQNSFLDTREFSVAPPADTSNITDYASLLPSSLRGQSLQIYTWPDCTLAELTSLCTSGLPEHALPSPAVGTKLVFRLVFPDTRASVAEGGRGVWLDKPLGSVVIGGANADANGDTEMTGTRNRMIDDAEKTLAGAKFVIGDYIACSIFPPGPDGAISNVQATSARGPPRGAFGGPSRDGPFPRRENGFGGGYGRGGPPGRADYGGGYGRRGGGPGGAAPPPGDWPRGERPEGPRHYYDDSRRDGPRDYYGDSRRGGGHHDGYRGGYGRPY